MTRELFFPLFNFLHTQCYVWCDVVCSHSRLANKIIQQKSPIEYRGFILISEFWAIHSSLSYTLATLLYKSVSQLSSGILTRRMEGKWRTLSWAEGNFAKEKRCRESEQLHKQHRKVQSMKNYWVCSLKKAICFAWISLALIHFHIQQTWTWSWRNAAQRQLLHAAYRRIEAEKEIQYIIESFELLYHLIWKPSQSRREFCCLSKFEIYTGIKVIKKKSFQSIKTLNVVWWVSTSEPPSAISQLWKRVGTLLCCWRCKEACVWLIQNVKE